MPCAYYKLKPATIKEKLKVKVTTLDVTDPSLQDVEKSKKKLASNFFLTAVMLCIFYLFYVISLILK